MAPIHHGPANMSDRRLHICLILETHRMMDGTQEQGKRRFFGLNVTLVVSRLYTEEREEPYCCAQQNERRATNMAGRSGPANLYIYIRDELCFIITRSCLSLHRRSFYMYREYVQCPPPPLM
jgi:hypothetical protein